MDCLFCKIVAKKFPAKIIFEDEKMIAFEDVNPQAPVHVLVVPKKHISTVLEIDPADNDLVGHMFQVAGNISRKRNIADRGFRLVMNCNSEAGQTVFHIHLHMLGGRPMQWPPG
ncbi:MAG TPA: histidine triad nucleotide-binding protein [Nitrospirae bacterium]|nr:histidine triad nucleotide-binding protein [Nitrospirota bacterium]